MAFSRICELSLIDITVCFFSADLLLLALDIVNVLGDDLPAKVGCGF